MNSVLVVVARCCAVLVCTLGAQAAAAAGRMPEVAAESLAEVKVQLPQGLPAERTLVFIGFEFDHQKKMDEWVEKMKLRADDKPWVQLHGISRGYGLISGFINSRKRPYFPEAYQRERVIPVYVNVSAFITEMGFADDRSAVLAAVVDREGKVLAMTRGDYSDAQAQALLDALHG
jgi:hypothetical protein